jgi:transketolase C-terminal domain/subunit
VAELLSSLGTAVKLLRIGVHGFGQSGTPEANYEHYGFTPQAIAKTVNLNLGA